MDPREINLTRLFRSLNFTPRDPISAKFGSAILYAEENDRILKATSFPLIIGAVKLRTIISLWNTKTQDFPNDTPVTIKSNGNTEVLRYGDVRDQQLRIAYRVIYFNGRTYQLDDFELSCIYTYKLFIWANVCAHCGHITGGGIDFEEEDNVGMHFCERKELFNKQFLSNEIDA